VPPRIYAVDLAHCVSRAVLLRSGLVRSRWVFISAVSAPAIAELASCGCPGGTLFLADLPDDAALADWVCFVDQRAGAPGKRYGSLLHHSHARYLAAFRRGLWARRRADSDCLEPEIEAGRMSRRCRAGSTVSRRTRFRTAWVGLCRMHSCGRFVAGVYVSDPAAVARLSSPRHGRERAIP